LISFELEQKGELEAKVIDFPFLSVPESSLALQKPAYAVRPIASRICNNSFLSRCVCAHWLILSLVALLIAPCVEQYVGEMSDQQQHDAW